MNELEVAKKLIDAYKTADEMMTIVKTTKGEHKAMRVSLEMVKTLLPKAEAYIGGLDKAKSDDEEMTSIAKIAEDGSVNLTINPELLKTAAVSNPFMLLIIAALTVIEKDIKTIMDIEKQILSFLENEKESEIEGDLKTVSSIISKYTANHDNEKFVSSNHKLVLDIQRTARKNMAFYKKNIDALIRDNGFSLSQASVETLLNKYEKQFNYFKMTIFVFSVASLLEILLSGNFKEDNVSIVKNEISEAGESYLQLHKKCTEKLTKLSKETIESNTVRGAGIIVEFTGKLFKKSERLNDTGDKLASKGNEIIDKSNEIEKQHIEAFQNIKDPQVQVFLEKMEEIIFIFNHTGEICLGNECLFLLDK